MPAVCPLPTPGINLLPPTSTAGSQKWWDVIHCMGWQGCKPQIDSGDLEDGEQGLQSVLEPQLPTAIIWARQERRVQGV